MKPIETAFATLVEAVSCIDGVLSIGRSGGRPLPETPADGDIDVFLYCSRIPTDEERAAALFTAGLPESGFRVGVFSGGHWGTGDLVDLLGFETWLMYMTTDEASAEIDAVLRGERPGREGQYYPTGRCAMVQTMTVLLDRTGFLAGMKETLSVYPEALAHKLADHHLACLDDVESIERASLRGDVLFYHAELDLALDHFLQALFAVNRTFFPSRKRSMESVDRFAIKPDDCRGRLLDAVRLGGTPEGVAQSYEIWKGLVRDLKELHYGR